jgi:hypothetical protein
MAEQFQNTTDFSLKSVAIARLGETEGYDIKQMVNSFSYVENVASPFVAATMLVVDSAGFMNDLPIQGGETVVVTVQTSSTTEPQEYQLSVWRIANRGNQGKAQAYTLGLVSVEALNNECVRLLKKLEGKPDDIIKKMLREDLNTQKDFFPAETTTQFAVKMLPANRRPFDIISSLAVKSVQSGTSTTAGNSGGSSTSNEKETVSGSAGYFFWENKRGYNFFSVDSLLDKEKEDIPTWGPYIEKPANQSDGADDRFTIAQATFSSEVDIMTSMRMGKYSSLMVFFNHSTGQYHEYHYSVRDAYKDMKHLGAQNTPSLIKFGDKDISDYPTRIISTLIDHESWYNEPGIASYEEEDGADTPSEFCDFHKHFAAQSLMRYELLKTQMGTIVIPGNSEICAGDRIEIKLVNKTSTEVAKDQPYDEESSGIYLIEEVTHTYDTTQGANGKFVTTLRLMRDSYGDVESTHGN